MGPQKNYRGKQKYHKKGIPGHTRKTVAFDGMSQILKIAKKQPDFEIISKFLLEKGGEMPILGNRDLFYRSFLVYHDRKMSFMADKGDIYY